MSIIQERIEYNRHHPKEQMRSQTGVFDAFLQEVHSNATSLMEKIASSGEKFLDYWPVFALINPHVDPIKIDGYGDRVSSSHSLSGERGIGYLLLTDKNVRLGLISSFSTRFHPFMDPNLLTEMVKSIFSSRKYSSSLKPIKSDIFFEQELQGFQMTSIKHEYDKDTIGVQFSGWHIEIVEVLENTLPDIYNWLSAAKKSTEPPSSLPSQTTKQKLLELEDLLSDGLISHDEYVQKRQQILSQL